MLKITRIDGAGPGVLVKVEGKLLQPWVEELTRACTQWATSANPLRLDLSAVTFVDAAGTQLLRELMRQGIAIAACSPFVAELLGREHS
jgi:anti-anti-sigma regulatory factor